MNFFLLGCEMQGNPVPRVVSWRDRMDCHAVLHRELGRLPERSLLYIEPDPETLFADILTAPFFMVSDMVWEVMGMYGLGRLSRQVILLDSVNRRAESYRMPQLQVEDGRNVRGYPCIPCIAGCWRDVNRTYKIVRNNTAGLREEDKLSAVTTGSFLVCAYGGLIEPVSSGQDEPRGLAGPGEPTTGTEAVIERQGGRRNGR